MPTNILIIGGGAGGLVLATKLGNTLGKRGLANITLVDAQPTHLWKPRLHEVAAGVINSYVDELPYAAHARQHHFRFVLGRLKGIDRAEQRVTLERYEIDGAEIIAERTLPYDTLVLALGSQTNDFGTAGAREHCIFLDQRDAAERFHREFINTYLKASTQQSERGSQRFNIAIVGAGATGVELAAELDHAADALYLYGFDGIQPDNVSITIIEAADRVMPALLPEASKAISKQLESMYINVLCNERVTEVTSEGVKTDSGKFIPAQLKVWSAGVKASPLLSKLDGLSTNRINQIKVDGHLRSIDDPRIFALGDCAECIPEGSDKPVPPRAQVAAQQADYLAKALKRAHSNKSTKAFKYKDKGSLVSLSKSGSVGQLMGNLSGDFTFEGRLARWFYIMLYRLHQRSLHGTLKMCLLIIRDRLNKRTNPKIKLH
ncbi:MAG: NAD(P)/FAD-dependent oxidoreductase [Oleiphilaceae bacterium]|nr:NAD(P)/FAD-dependent oxidoreductase [Oleiphilaceae bacterium]